MGRHSRPSRVASLVCKATSGAPAAVAVSALFLTPAAHAQTVTPQRPTPATTAAKPDLSYKPTIRESVARAVSFTTIVVHPGNTLSGIAADDCGNPADWTGIAAANKSQVKDPNLIYPDEKLVLSCRTANVSSPDPHPSITFSVHRVVRTDPYDGHHGRCGDGDKDGMDASCSAIFPQRYGSSSSEDGDGGGAAPVSQYHHHHYVTQAPSGNVNPGNYSGMTQCIISRESGGNSQVMNSSGHYGLFQFSASTWAAHGGNPGDFGHASASEQFRVYYATVAQDGYSDWAPYDGC